MFDHFGLLAPIYERFINSSPPKKLIEIARLPISGSLLDVGGGTGRVSQFLIKEASQVFIADLSLKMLLESHRKIGLKPVCSYSERLPFPENYFERIIMIDTLHHVVDQKQTTKELWRVLKPGGRIIIEEPNIQHWGVKLVALGEKIALMRSHFLNPSEITDLFRSFPGEKQTHLENYFSWFVIDK
jgi:demethylmenaquinone methyltransferase/2-methoxy-6-polyprenyl-1,4-benzoquinol methylase